MHFIARNVDYIPRPYFYFIVAQQYRGPTMEDEHAVLMRVLVQTRVPPRL
jgi:hypothetical protein